MNPWITSIGGICLLVLLLVAMIRAGIFDGFIEDEGDGDE